MKANLIKRLFVSPSLVDQLILVAVNPGPLGTGTILRCFILIFAVLNGCSIAGTENVVHRKIRGNFSVGGFSLGNSVIESELSEEEGGLIKKLSEMNKTSFSILANCRSFRISPVIVADRTEETITIDSKHIAIAHTISTTQLNMMGYKYTVLILFSDYKY